MKGYSTLLGPLEHEPHHQMQFKVMPRAPVLGGDSFYLSAEYTCSIQGAEGKHGIVLKMFFNLISLIKKKLDKSTFSWSSQALFKN